MSKITLGDFGSQYNSWQRLNSNNTLIEEAIENTLSRDGTTPNQMEAVLDMNSNHIINLPAPLTADEPVRVADVDEIVAEAILAVDGATVYLSMWDERLIDRVKTPPSSPVPGDSYLVHSVGLTGAFIGKADQVARYVVGGTWEFSGQPKAGQIVTLRGVLFQYQTGNETQIDAGTLRWQPYNGRRISVTTGAQWDTVGDSITLSPNLAGCWPSRTCLKWGGVDNNDGVSGTGVWNATYHAYANRDLSKSGSHKVSVYAAGHNNCVYTTDITKNNDTIYYEVLNFLISKFCDFLPASSMTPTGTWVTDTGDALGFKTQSNQSGVGNLCYSIVPTSTLSGSFSGETFFLRCFRGDGVSANRSADIRIFIDGSEREAYVDPGTFEYQSFEGTHIGHAVKGDAQWGAGSHIFTLTAGANAAALRPAYIDGVSWLRSPTECNPVLIQMPVRPYNYAATGPGTATDATFEGAEDAIRRALAWFKDYPWAVVYPNEYCYLSTDFADGEHPTAGGAMKMVYAAEAAIDGQSTFSSYGRNTPTGGNLSNVSAVLSNGETWFRVGNVVNVSGNVEADAIATGAAGFTLTLPVPSNLANSSDLGGVAAANTVQQTIRITANTAADAAFFLWNASDTTNLTYNYNYSYIVR